MGILSSPGVIIAPREGVSVRKRATLPPGVRSQEVWSPEPALSEAKGGREAGHIFQREPGLLEEDRESADRKGHSGGRANGGCADLHSCLHCFILSPLHSWIPSLVPEGKSQGLLA